MCFLFPTLSTLRIEILQLILQFYAQNLEKQVSKCPTKSGKSDRYDFQIKEVESTHICVNMQGPKVKSRQKKKILSTVTKYLYFTLAAQGQKSSPSLHLAFGVLQMVADGDGAVKGSKCPITSGHPGSLAVKPTVAVSSSTLGLCMQDMWR